MLWSEGRCLALDFTCPDTKSYQPCHSWSRNCSIRRRNTEESQVCPTAYSMLFVPIAIEIFGAFGKEATKFMSELGRRLIRTTQDKLLVPKTMHDYAEAMQPVF